MVNRRAFFLTLAPFLLGAASASAGDDHRHIRKVINRGDHDRARQALQQGEIRSLSDILMELRAELGGEVIEVDLEKKGAIYVYELKVLTPNGRVREVYIDASTGKVIKGE